MGIKKLKEKYDITHIIQREKKGICIGSDYVHDLIVITPELEILKSSILSDSGALSDIYKQIKFDYETGELAKILEEKDIFSNLKNIWTYDRGHIIKKQCEKIGWPNLTTDGYIIYDNTFFKSRKEALKACRVDAIYSIKNLIKYHFTQLFTEIKNTLNYSCIVVKSVIRSYLFFGLL